MPVYIPDRVLYLFHPRTGSIATRDSLLKLPGAVIVGNHHDTIKQIGGERVISTIRNVYTLLDTWYTVSGYTDPEKFLAEYSHGYMHRNGRLYYHAEYCHNLIKYEKLEEQLAQLLGQPIKLEKVNTTPNKHRDIFTSDKKLVAIVEEKYKKDIRLWRRCQ